MCKMWVVWRNNFNIITYKPNNTTIKKRYARTMVLSQQLTKEPSERLCLMEEPPSDKIFICPPFACITLLIFFIHSVFSLALSAFKTTAL